MKKLFFLFALTGLTALLFTNTGCNPDDPVNVGPTLDFLAQSPDGATTYFTTDFTINDTATYVPLGIEAGKGSSDLKTFTILEDGVNISPDRVILKDLRTGNPITFNNPMLLLGDWVNGFEFEVLIDVHDEYATHDYTFEVADVNGEKTSKTIAITAEFGGTPIEMTLTGILLNQAGPVGTGGLDLDEGIGTGTQAAADTIAEIRDNGIDLSQPLDQNWLRQISPMNGAQMRVPGANFPSDFDFTSVATKEEIRTYFDDGDPLPAEINGMPASNPVEVGDIFFVERNGRYYLLEVTDINVTPDDNDDSYTFNIKY